MSNNAALFQYLLRLGDDALITGHRLSEWCGHAPILEEDIALANIALDCVGQATLLLDYAAKLENSNRDADALAFLRDPIDFRNLQICEVPNGDFAQTVLKHFLFSAYRLFLYDELGRSKDSELAAISKKSLKEIRYHFRHSREWVLRLGDGTAESHDKIQNALTLLWPYTSEFFVDDPEFSPLIQSGIVPKISELEEKWVETVTQVLSEATLSLGSDTGKFFFSKQGASHTEHLGHLLAEMQILPRSFPGASW